MSDNYYIDDLIVSLEKNIVMERYYPLIDYKGELTEILSRNEVTRKNDVTDGVIEEIRMKLGDAVANLFARYIRIYDFNKSKLRDIKAYIGSKDYDTLSDLLRLPGVRLLRAELYFGSGVTLKVLAEKPTEDIRNMVHDYIQRENRSEIIPLPKEVNCHRAVAKMILHADNR